MEWVNHDEEKGNYGGKWAGLRKVSDWELFEIEEMRG